MILYYMNSLFCFIAVGLHADPIRQNAASFVPWPTTWPDRRYA